MQAAIKVGLYPSNDVISWTDSLGVAFQATPGLVSCTPTEGQSHLRVFFFFFRFFVHFQWLVANYHTAPAPHCAGTAINKTSWVSKRLWKHQSTCGQMTYNQMYLHCWSSGWPAVQRLFALDLKTWDFYLDFEVQLPEEILIGERWKLFF